MSGQPNISQNNEQILNDIQTLQQIEQQLFNNLETNTSLTPQQQQEIVEKMNQISNMRINLYQTLSGVNNFFQNALSSSVGTLKEQTVAIAIVENELNQAKKRLEVLEDEKNNKIRLVEINSYYGDKYAEHSQLMKIVIYTLVPVIIISIFNSAGVIPQTVYIVLVSIIALIGAYFFWRRYFSIITRDNMNYQEYDWYFNPPASGGSTSSSDPWLGLGLPGTCVGQYCCSSGQVWDASMNQCIGNSTVSPVVAPTTTSPSTANSSSSSASASGYSSYSMSSFEPFMTESMVNNVLTKKQPNKYKTDYDMSTYIQAPMSKSFINN